MRYYLCHIDSISHRDYAISGLIHSSECMYVCVNFVCAVVKDHYPSHVDTYTLKLLLNNYSTPDY